MSTPGQSVDQLVHRMRGLLAEFARCHRMLENVLEQSRAGETMSEAREILDLVSIRYGVLPSVLLGRQRTHTVAEARQVAMVLTRELTKHSMPEIGALYRRDHGTVLWSIKAIAARRATDSRFALRFTQLRQECVEVLGRRASA